jgi:cysteine desulfurase
MTEWLRERGGEVSFLPVDNQGSPLFDELKNIARPETALVSAIWVNNETGVISDIDAATSACQKMGIPLHLDGAQAWGKLNIDLAMLARQAVSYASFAPYKIGSLAGTGVFWSKKQAPVVAVLRGKHQGGRRGGTENVSGIIAAGIAAETVASQIKLAEQQQIAEHRNRLQTLILDKISGVTVNGAKALRIAGTLNLCFDGIQGEGLIPALDLEGYQVSSGSACSSGSVEVSHVLQALGLSRELAATAVRVSFSSQVSWPQLQGFAEALEKVVGRMRTLKKSGDQSNANCSIPSL